MFQHPFWGARKPSSWLGPAARKVKWLLGFLGDGATLSLRHSGHISLIWLPTGKTSATFHEDPHLTEYFLAAQRAAGWDCRLIRT